MVSYAIWFWMLYQIVYWKMLNQRIHEDHEAGFALQYANECWISQMRGTAVLYIVDISCIFGSVVYVATVKQVM